MGKPENARIFSLIAAICYMICALYNIIKRINRVLNSNYSSITALNIIFWIATLGMVVTLIMKNKNAVVAALGFNVLLRAYYIISYFSLWNLCNLVVYASAVALGVLSIKGNSIVKKLWLAPALVLLLGCVIGWFSGETFFVSVEGKPILFGFVEIAALLFVGMWIKEDPTPAAAVPVNEYATFNPQAMYSAPTSSATIGGADKLKMYKDLLDSGTITQEEFDVKKKEILGL